MNLGIIGFSEGNGHPYSWSAIFNGYDPAEMSESGFPVISEYLSQQNFPADQLKTATVTHVWTEDFELSQRISKASNIKHIVREFESMIPMVDGLLLARDDSESHKKYALPFLEAGLPIYIDKPLALSIDSAKDLLSNQVFGGQIFSCSALKYAAELRISEEITDEIGEIRFIDAIGPKGWDKYGVHLVDPVLKMLPNRGEILKSEVTALGHITTLTVMFESGVVARFCTIGDIPGKFKFDVYGDKSNREFSFSDSYGAFKNALAEFVKIAKNPELNSTQSDMLAVVELIERGRNV